MKKNVIIGLLSIPLLFSTLTACQKNNSESQSEQEPPKTYICDMLKVDNPYSLLVPASATDTEIYAAQEIVTYFSSVTGVTLEIIYDANTEFSMNSNIISIGNTTPYEEAVNRHGEVDLSREALNTDGFVIFTLGTSVYINAYKERGKLYGAYEFIETTLGVKFLNYRYTHIPHLEEVPLYSYDKTYVPMFAQRAYLNTSVFEHDQLYTSHMRFNTDYCQLDNLYGGSTRWCSFNGNTSHTMAEIVPYRYYTVGGQTDAEGNPLIMPEYRKIFAHTGSGDNISLIWFYNGTVIDYCFTSGINDDGSYNRNEEISLAKLTIESLKSWIRNNPDCENFMIGQHDTESGCPCDRCKAAALKYNGGGRMVRFVNVVAKEIKDWMKEEHMDREVNFCIFAYQYTANSPINEAGEIPDSTVIPREDVYVKWAPIKTAFYYSPDDPRQNVKSEYNNLLGWQRVTNRFHAWTYHCWYGNSLWYYPTTHVFKDLMRLLKKAGVVYEFAQGPYYEYNLYQSDLDAYVFSKLCWNFNLKIQDIVDEYNRYYFGEDAFEDISKFHIDINDRYAYMASLGETMQVNNSLMKEEFWPYAITKKLVSYFDNAVAKTEANPNLSERQKATYIENIERAELSPLWMRLSMFDWYVGVDEEKAQTAERFIQMGNKYGLKRYGEPYENSFDSIKAKYGIS